MTCPKLHIRYVKDLRFESKPFESRALVYKHFLSAKTAFSLPLITQGWEKESWREKLRYREIQQAWKC